MCVYLLHYFYFFLLSYFSLHVPIDCFLYVVGCGNLVKSPLTALRVRDNKVFVAFNIIKIVACPVSRFQVQRFVNSSLHRCCIRSERRKREQERESNRKREREYKIFGKHCELCKHCCCCFICRKCCYF